MLISEYMKRDIDDRDKEPRSFFRRFRATIIATLIGVAVWVLTLMSNIELFEILTETLESLEQFEADEIFMGAIFIGIGLIIDFRSMKRRRDHQLEIFKQRLAVLKSTMHSVEDIVGNSLNRLQLFRLQAEECADFPQDSIKELDNMIRETSARLKTLSDLEDTPEREVISGFNVLDISRDTSQSEDE